MGFPRTTFAWRIVKGLPVDSPAPFGVEEKINDGHSEIRKVEETPKAVGPY
jgi:hypothetical protein